MNPTGLLLAVVGGGMISLLPVISWWQGEGLARQMWMFVLGHVIALAAVGAVAGAFGAPSVGARFLVMAALAGACCGMNGALYYAGVMPRGPMSVSWAIIWLGAVIVAAAGWLLLGEPIYLAQPFALASFVACLAVMGWATYRINRRVGAVQPVRRGFWSLLLVAMAVGVAGVLLIKLRPALPAGEDPLPYELTFVTAFIAGLTAAMLATAVVLRARPPTDRRTLLASLSWAGVVAPYYLLLVWGLRITPASVFQPTLSGTALVCGVAWAAVRGERSGRLVYLGAALALLSIALINMQGWAIRPP